MRNIIYVIFGFLILISNANAKEKRVLLDELTDYNINLVSVEDGIYQYMGSNDGLSINFLATEKEVMRINYIFANGSNEKYAEQVAEVTQKLIPKKFANTDKLSSQLLSSLNKLRREGNDEKFNLGGSRFEVKLMNGMIHMQAVPYKYVNRTKTL